MITVLSVLVPLATAAGAGLFAAAHSASWGAFKDSPFEGFRLSSYLRTLALGALLAVVLFPWLPVTSPAALVVLVGVTYALERLGTEWWKSILRDDDQSAYAIPMRLGLRGRPVEDRRVRYSVGALVAVVVGTALVGLHVVHLALPGAPPLIAALTVGGLGGWATAIGGAWKDAPVEGFSPWKFLRSPVVATAWALPLSLLTTSWPALLLAAAGYAVVSIETYKTFFSGGRAPGKFAGKPIRAALPVLRRVLATQNAVWWVGLAAALALTAASPGYLATGTGLVLLTVATAATLVAVAVTRTGLGRRLAYLGGLA